MKSFASRRCVNASIFLALAAVVAAAYSILTVAMYPTAFLSGWMLLVLIVFLTAYNARKKLPFLPLANSAVWLQVHVYAGLLTFVLFFIHIQGRVFNGFFESALGLLYLAVAGSGVLGLALTRMVPRRLTIRGEEVLFERIPIFIRRLREDVEELVVNCITETDSTAVPDFYTARLRPFFEQPRYFWRHLVHSRRHRHNLLKHIEAQDKYLNDTERNLMRKIADRVCVKDDLDYQYAMQATLKYWLFVHVPLTYALLLFALAHVLLVYAFSGGVA